MALQPRHPGVPPWALTSFCLICAARTSGSSMSGAGAYVVLRGASSGAILAYAWILRCPDPGVGSCSDPAMLWIISRLHRWSAGRLLIVLTLNMPSAVPTRCSPDLDSTPAHTPFSHLSSKEPILRFVLGILNMTTSPNGTSGVRDLRPFISCHAVRPQSLTLETLMICAACRTSNGTMGSLRLILPFVLISSAALSVLTRPLRSCTARSTLPLELLSPTLDCSSAEP